MATYSSILVWEIPRTEEPGRLQSTGSQKIWTRLNDKQQQTCKLWISQEDNCKLTPKMQLRIKTLSRPVICRNDTN